MKHFTVKCRVLLSVKCTQLKSVKIHELIHTGEKSYNWKTWFFYRKMAKYTILFSYSLTICIIASKKNSNEKEKKSSFLVGLAAATIVKLLQKRKKPPTNMHSTVFFWVGFTAVTCLTLKERIDLGRRDEKGEFHIFKRGFNHS